MISKETTSAKQIDVLIHTISCIPRGGQRCLIPIDEKPLYFESINFSIFEMDVEIAFPANPVPLKKGRGDTASPPFCLAADTAFSVDFSRFLAIIIHG